MNPLDFLVIGAQKCATTTLFEQLRVHPRIAMPVEKEVPFFTGEHVTADAWNRYSDRYFGPVDGRLRGKVTPQYLCDPSSAERIARLMPDVKLVVMLRDPMERTWSHYRMDCRRGTEQRPFAEVVEGLLDPAVLERNRSLPVPRHAAGYEPESDFHIAWSEYGRAMVPFLERFPSDRVLVLYLEDLARDPAAVLDRLLVFLGLEAGFRPPALGKVVHAGGSKNRISHGLRVRVRSWPGIRHLWQALPEERRGRLRFLYERWNGSKKSRAEQPILPPSLDTALARHFAEDLGRLPASLGAPPWLGRYVHA